MATTLDIGKLRSLAAEVTSLAALQRLLGGICKRRLRRVLRENDIGTAHFRPAGGGNRKDIAVYLSNERYLSSDHLKKRLFREGIKTPVCERCNRSEWEGSPIPVELHHVDGNRFNNRLENLKILCRNCHGLEPNHKGAAAKRPICRKVTREEYINVIPKCSNVVEVCRVLGLSPKGRNYDTIQGIMAKEGLTFIAPAVTDHSQTLTGLYSHISTPPKPKPSKPKSTEITRERRRLRERKIGTRKEAAFLRRKVKERPTAPEMQKLLWEMPVEQIGAKYGVNGNAIRSWLKGYEVPMQIPPSGYWVRRHAGYTHEEALLSQKKITKPLRRPTEEQAKVVLELLKQGWSLRKAGLTIGFDHETTKAALIRFGLFPSDYKSPRGRPRKHPDEHKETLGG